MYGTDTLTLNPNGIYAQKFTFKSGKVSNNTGAWKFKNGELWLDNAIVVDSGNGTPRSTFDRGLWVMTAGRSLNGKIYIRVNEDLNLSFQ
jgi:hypothetical protein